MDLWVPWQSGLHRNLASRNGGGGTPLEWGIKQKDSCKFWASQACSKTLFYCQDGGTEIGPSLLFPPFVPVCSPLFSLPPQYTSGVGDNRLGRQRQADLLSLKPAWPTKQVPGQPEIHRETNPILKTTLLPAKKKSLFPETAIFKFFTSNFVGRPLFLFLVWTQNWVKIEWR